MVVLIVAINPMKPIVVSTTIVNGCVEIITNLIIIRRKKGIEKSVS